MSIPIYYVSSEEEAKNIRKNSDCKIIIFISGKEDMKSNLKDFFQSTIRK